MYNNLKVGDIVINHKCGADADRNGWYWNHLTKVQNSKCKKYR